MTLPVIPIEKAQYRWFIELGGAKTAIAYYHRKRTDCWNAYVASNCADQEPFHEMCKWDWLQIEARQRLQRMIVERDNELKIAAMKR